MNPLRPTEQIQSQKYVHLNSIYLFICLFIYSRFLLSSKEEYTMLSPCEGLALSRRWMLDNRLEWLIVSQCEQICVIFVHRHTSANKCYNSTWSIKTAKSTNWALPGQVPEPYMRTCGNYFSASLYFCIALVLLVIFSLSEFLLTSFPSFPEIEVFAYWNCFHEVHTFVLVEIVLISDQFFSKKYDVIA